MKTLPELIFHLAIPTHDLELARQFYIDKLHCRLARKYEDRITLEFYGHQIVCHLAPDKIDTAPQEYPRHFGITFRDFDPFDSLHKQAIKENIPFFKQRFTRFEGRPDAHESFFLIDPSNNLLEFKHYTNPEKMY